MGRCRSLQNFLVSRPTRRSIDAAFGIDLVEKGCFRLAGNGISTVSESDFRLSRPPISVWRKRNEGIADFGALAAKQRDKNNWRDL
jgi:hypothetical protein